MALRTFMPAAFAGRPCPPARSEGRSDSPVTPRSDFREVSLPQGVIAIDQEVRAALDRVAGLARRRFVELQVAAEPGIVARADPNELRVCLDHLLLAAIGRAAGAVLVVAKRQSDASEIAVLDDGSAGIAASDAQGHVPSPPHRMVTATHHSGRGTTVTLRLMDSPSP